MIPKKGISILFMFICLFAYSQDSSKYNSLLISEDLTENANSVIRKNDEIITIEAYDKMHYTLHRIITVFNKEGNSDIDAYAFYNKSTHIKKLEAKIYNQFGEQIKKIKSRDFKDVSAVSGGTLYSDDRVKYLDYTPISYPYTVEFFLDYKTSSTAFIRSWRPVRDFMQSIEESSYQIDNLTDIELKFKEYNFEGFDVLRKEDFSYVANNIPALKTEAYKPAFNKVVPIVRFALSKFNMEGVKGQNDNWTDFGKWILSDLIEDTQELPASTQEHIIKLTKDAKTDIEKAKIVYEYVQNKTRYISVQIGIGGWKPIDASEVDKVSYGDCKGLTNYTKSLLDAAGVESYYTVIYGGRNIKNIDKDFSATEGNHAILCLPNEGDYIWLECTSQTNPFGYTANFTDDRDALVITPDGGKIVHTKAYKTLDNLLETTANVTLLATGGFNASVELISKGTQYDYHEGIERDILKDQELHYKDYWSYINNLSIDKMNFTNNKDDIVFTENIDLTTPKYASQTSNLLLLEPNFFNRITSAPSRYRNRKLPFEVARGFIDKDSYEIELPNGFLVDALQEPVSIVNKFGEYHMSVEQKTPESIVYKRKFILNKGNYNKEEYKDFRKFWLQVIRHDKSKIVLKNTTKP